MEEHELDNIIGNSIQEIYYVITKVKERGYRDTEKESDIYYELLKQRGFKELITMEIYESYFLPERHEFDYQIIHQIVEAMTDPALIEFLKVTITTGIIGGASFKAVEILIQRVVESFKKYEFPKSRREPYELMLSDINKIRNYFDQNDSARISEIESSISIPRERIYPILKLLGFIHHRRKQNCLWVRPDKSHS